MNKPEKEEGHIQHSARSGSIAGNDITTPLTDDGYESDHKVEDVDAVGEEVASQCDEFDDDLSEEDEDEDEVNPVENHLHDFALVVHLHHQGHHIQADHHHHEDLERLFSDQVEEQGPAEVLEKKDKQMVTETLGESYTCPYV